LEFLAKGKGDKYKCESCGLMIVVEEPCDCGDSCEIMCCEQPMKKVVKPKTDAKPMKKTAAKK
jgi:hypothetical protein